MISVRDLATVASQYPHHPEPKRCGPDGKPCHKQTEGMLSRRPIQAAGHVCIGKEAHRLEERELVSDLQELQSTYADPRREPWTTFVLPKLRIFAGTLEGRRTLIDISGLSIRTLRDVLAGRSRPGNAATAALWKLANDRTFAIRRCAGCGAPIDTPDPRQQFCSMRCRERMKKRRRRQCQPLAAFGAEPDA